jgi:Fic family protein
MPEPTLYLSSFFERHRQQYMDLLLAVSQRGDWGSWVDFFLRAVRTCADESRVQADGLLELRDKYLDRFRSARSSALLQKLIDHLFRQPSVTIGEAAELLSVSQATASSNIKKLVQAGMLREITGRRKGQFFVADEIVSFSSDVAALPTRAEDEQFTRTATE